MTQPNKGNALFSECEGFLTELSEADETVISGGSSSSNQFPIIIPGRSPIIPIPFPRPSGGGFLVGTLFGKLFGGFGRGRRF